MLTNTQEVRLILIPLLAQHRTSRKYNNVNVYNYFFYRLYCWSAQWKNDVARPEFNAFAIVSAVLVGHAIFCVQLVELICGFRIIALLPKYLVYAAVIIFEYQTTSFCFTGTDTRRSSVASRRNLLNYENVVKRPFGFTFT